MRPATHAAALALLAAALMAAAPPALADPAPTPAADTPPPAADAPQPAATPPPAGDASATDMRCIVVAAALTESDDPQLKSLARASLFYYIGRLQGRGDTANVNARIVDEAAKMTGDDIKAEANVCSGLITAAAQSLEDLSKAFEQHFGGGQGTAGSGTAGGVGPK